MVTAEGITARREQLSEGDLPALVARLVARVAPAMATMPTIPAVKAFLSSDGGVCPDCAAQLEFDPWSPDRHRCPGCGRDHSGERHHGHWARAQHLWVSERAATLATLAAMTGETGYGERARDLLAAYFSLYFDLPNDDNVLGPSHLFFSTYLESIWILNYLAAAEQLRAIGVLSEADIEAVGAIADEAANLIGEFNEGLSNRQTWHSAALVAIAVWFGDEDLAQASIEGPTGLLGHLAEGFGDDGMWREGENYHLFAIRGLLIGLDWARAAGADLLTNPEVAEVVGRALMAPAVTALPDLTFPARKDSRFGVSLAHPAYLECWEIGLSRLGDHAPTGLAAWLEALYGCPASVAQTYEAYLHDAGEDARDVTGRSDLSWWVLLGMEPRLPAADEPSGAESALLADQGVAILRRSARYVAVECGAFGGGHGHPDRLHLTLHADGVHWLADPGTGLYVSSDLFWYRSTLAHNAPRLDGVSQPPDDARCLAFDCQGEWNWISARFDEVDRAVVEGPDWILDVVTVRDEASHRLELPWHLDGDLTVDTAGSWRPAELVGRSVSGVEEFSPEGEGGVVITAVSGGHRLRLHLAGGTLLRAVGPGRPGQPARTFFVVRSDGVGVRLAAVLDLGGKVKSVVVGQDQVEVAQEGAGTTTIHLTSTAATISGDREQVSLSGALPAAAERKVFLPNKPIPVEGQALRIDTPPALDGSLDGFDGGFPLVMADEGHYYRSELPYQGPDTFCATGYVNWDHEHLYLAVEVIKPLVVVREAAAPPLRLDNDPEDVHSDGIQVYYRVGDVGQVDSFLIRPTEAGGLIARRLSDDRIVPLGGASARTADGYVLTVALPCPDLDLVGRSTRVAFDLCVNEMRPGRLRRAGQLAWGGGNGWVYLRGDRRDERTWGVLELIG